LGPIFPPKEGEKILGEEKKKKGWAPAQKNECKKGVTLRRDLTLLRKVLEKPRP